MIVRYAAGAASAIVFTFALFFLMQSLIASRSTSFRESEKSWGLDFVRLKREERIERKNRERPKQVEQKEFIPRIATVKNQTNAPQMKVVKVDAPKFNPTLALAGGPTTLAAGADTDVVPLVRVDARYPSRAQARGIEGWVYLRFTVTAQGTTSDIEVLDSDPKGTFDRAAVRAVEKYKYKPRIEAGTPVPRPGVEIVLSFELED